VRSLQQVIGQLVSRSVGQSRPIQNPRINVRHERGAWQRYNGPCARIACTQCAACAAAVIACLGPMSPSAISLRRGSIPAVAVLSGLLHACLQTGRRLLRRKGCGPSPTIGRRPLYRRAPQECRPHAHFIALTFGKELWLLAANFRVLPAVRSPLILYNVRVKMLVSISQCQRPKSWSVAAHFGNDT
jgi:hypothetical protein